MPNIRFLPGIEKTDGEDDLQIAIKIALGELPSPHAVPHNAATFFAIRITGTGFAVRDGQEFVYRKPEAYLTDDFLARCNGLPVIIEHPEATEENPLGMLTSEDFEQRGVGTIFLPYIDTEKEEVWGIAKIFDAASAGIMELEQLSTSPGVVFLKSDDNETMKLGDGTTLAVEGKPRYLDHVAICKAGVWDKAGPPSGVISSEKGLSMDEQERLAEEAKKKAAAEEAARLVAEAKAKADSTGEQVGVGSPAAPTMQQLLDAVLGLGKRIEAIEQGQATHAAADSAEEAAKKKAEEEGAKAKADEAERLALQERIAALEGAMPKPVSDNEYAEMAEVQAQADSVASAFGGTASRPLNGETLFAYRKRLANGFKKHSPAYAEVDVLAISDSKLFAIAEKQIYLDSMEAAKNPKIDASMGLFESKTRDATGRQISTFHGTPSAWTSQFKSPARRVTAINKGA